MSLLMNNQETTVEKKKSSQVDYYTADDLSDERHLDLESLLISDWFVINAADVDSVRFTQFIESGVDLREARSLTFIEPLSENLALNVYIHNEVTGQELAETIQGFMQNGLLTLSETFQPNSPEFTIG